MKEYFSAKKFHIMPLPVLLPSKGIAESAVELGSFYTADERLIAIYEVKLTDKALIQRNRAGLRNLFKSVIRYDLDVTFDKDNLHLPAYVEALLLQKYFDIYGCLPEWNKGF